MIMWGIDYAEQKIRNRRAPQLRNNVKLWWQAVNGGCVCLLIYMTIVIIGGLFFIWRIWA